jgi:hypothetical protein
VKARGRGRDIHVVRKCVDPVIHRLDGRIRSKDSYGNESTRRDREH